MSTVAAADAGPAVANRTLIVVSVMLASVMTTLDTTIANVALPHMAGSVSASADQIAWVLTSYIVAIAIVTPMSGWLTQRFGRKRILLIAVSGFIAASAFCGLAQNLSEIVTARILQGAFAGPLQPITQALLLDLFTLAERGPIMAIWGMGVMVVPIAGPVLGGWLTDTLSWRWVFYINVPIGALCLLGVATFVPSTNPQPATLNLKGLAMLSIALAALQIMLDRGQSQGWFDSQEIVIEAAVAATALWFFVVYSLTNTKPYIPLQIFKDRNFSMSLVLTMLNGVALMSVAALLPSMLQNLYGFPVATAGLLTAPRGVGSMISMLVAGRLVGRVDNRFLIAIGLIIYALCFFDLSCFTLDTSPTIMAFNGALQGLGTGFIFLPMTTMAFATLAPKFRPDAVAVVSLFRNIGASAGISIMLALLASFSAAVRDSLIVPYSSDNPTMANLPRAFNLADPNGVVMLSNEVDRQAAMVAYTQVFFVLSLAIVALAPLLLLMKPPQPVSQSVTK